MSLAKYKMDKIIQAVTIKGYSREPSMVHSLKFLWMRFNEEVSEIDREYDVLSPKDELPLMQKFIVLENCIQHSTSKNYSRLGFTVKPEDFHEMKRELADLSNFIDFVFDRILIIEKMVKGFED